MEVPVKNTVGRRRLKTRQYNVIKFLALHLSKTNITPNQVSVLSVICSVITFLIFYLINCFNFYKLSYSFLWLLAACFIQLRLACNMFDGLLAVEYHQSERLKSKLGDVYNEIPDRFSDIIIILGFGFSIDLFYSNIIYNSLVWSVIILSVITAYIRILFTALSAPSDYCGPMAKQHRMFLITLSCVFCFFYSNICNDIVIISIIILLLGLIVTLYRRLAKGINYLNMNN